MSILKGAHHAIWKGMREVVFTLYSLNINQQTFLHRLSTLVPVTKEALSERSQAMPLAISSGVPTRLLGIISEYLLSRASAFHDIDYH